MNAVSKRQSVTKIAEPRRERQHLTTLVAKTVQVRARLQELEDDYEEIVLSDPANRAKKNAHEAFVEYFNKHTHLHGLPKACSVQASPALCLLRLLRLQLLLCRRLLLLLRYISICCGWSQEWAGWRVNGMGGARGCVEQGSSVGLGGYRGWARSQALAKASCLGFSIVYKL